MALLKDATLEKLKNADYLLCRNMLRIFGIDSKETKTILHVKVFDEKTNKLSFVDLSDDRTYEWPIVLEIDNPNPNVLTIVEKKDVEDWINEKVTKLQREEKELQKKLNLKQQEINSYLDKLTLTKNDGVAEELLPADQIQSL